MAMMIGSGVITTNGMAAMMMMLMKMIANGEEMMKLMKTHGKSTRIPPTNFQGSVMSQLQFNRITQQMCVVIHAAELNLAHVTLQTDPKVAVEKRVLEILNEHRSTKQSCVLGKQKRVLEKVKLLFRVQRVLSSGRRVPHPPVAGRTLDGLLPQQQQLGVLELGANLVRQLTLTCVCARRATLSCMRS
jgi:hypothetical protein